MKFEEWWKDVSDAYFDRTDTYPSNVTKSFSRAAWEAAQAHDHAKAHAEPVVFAQVLESGDLRIDEGG